MSTLIITRGLPGSGKSTFARAWVAEIPTGRARLNRDDFRAQLHAGIYAGQATERQVTAAQHAAITALLQRGIDVIADDTNLPQRVARELRQLALRAGAEFTVVDMTNVSAAVCIERDRARGAAGGRTVGADVITDMHARYLAGKVYPLPLPIEPDAADNETGVAYEPVSGTPAAILVDVDGTVALRSTRSPFDWHRVAEDRPNLPVIDTVRALAAAGAQVVYCSGRSDVCRDATSAWLTEHVGVPFNALFMRPAGDMRKDSIVKRELFDQHIRTSFTVRCVLDDRDQVVKMWRSLGLTVLQVADGNF